MKIINKIEINYFRSAYSIHFQQIEDFNILVGNNDSGKSNILKALNLFFNNQTELDQPFYFSDDLTRKREYEARNTKGRATIWIKVYFNNFLNWKSLPKEFVVKKVWNRYSDYPEITYPKDISPTQVVKFLNKISFHYIPAIRGRNIFAHFLTMLHDALFDDEKGSLASSMDELIEIVNKNTIDMSSEIRDGVGIESSIQPPTDLRMLFNTLDFSTNYNEHYIPLQKRGDGIQSRHIPFILDFIAKHTKKYHIWAYEEPETSLELGAAFQLAEQFKTGFCEENQIFITTHSPAFYDLAGEHITKWYVCQDATDSDTETTIQQVTSEDLLDRNLGVAALIAERAREAYDQIEKLNQEKQRLDNEIEKNKMPHVIVEGVTDKTILEAAFEKLYPNKTPIFEFISADGALNIPPYLKSRKNIAQDIPNIIIGLFDSDHEGRKQIKEFRSCDNVDGTEFIRITNNKPLYAGLLPLPEEIKKLNQEVENYAEKIQFPVPIEFMFPCELIAQAVEENILEFDDRIARSTDSELPAEINLTEIYAEKLPRDYIFLARKVQKDVKTKFSEWVINQDAAVFENFRPLIEQLLSIIAMHNSTNLE